MLYIVFVLFSLFFFTPLFLSSVYAINLKINEVLVHPSSNNHEWVELYNPDTIDVSTYWIDDDADFSSDTGGSANKSLATLEQSNTVHPYIEISSSMFNNDGDSVVLFDDKGTVVDQYSYAKDPGTDVSFGRSPDGSSDFAVLTSATKGSVNTGVQPTPTLSPTKVPTPTHTPTPPHTPTPTKVPSPTPTSKTTAKNVSSTQNSISQKNYLVDDNVDLSNDSLPIDDMPSITATESSQEAVLAASISSKPTVTKKPKKLVKADKSTNWLPLIFSVAGGGCLLACGILLYLRIRGKHVSE